MNARRYATGFGVRVCLDVSDAAVEAVDAVLPYWWVDEEPSDAARVFDVQHPGIAADVVGELELWVAEHAEGLVFVHAGVVALGERALLLPGRSFAGKSTLTAELVRAGCAYGSDEYAVLQADGRVATYPRPIALRAPDGVQRVSVTELGGELMTEPLTVAAVAVLRYEQGAATQLQVLSPSAAALQLLANTVCASTRPQAALDAVSRAVHGARACTGIRGEARDAVAGLLDLLEPPAAAYL